MIIKRSSHHPDFVYLVTILDTYLAHIDGAENKFYKQYNTISDLKYCLVLYVEGKAEGCGAIKHFEDNTFEIKRMFVNHTARGKGYGRQIVIALENWARELGAEQLILETGKRMPDAVEFYKRLGFDIIDNYPPYVSIENSLCFKKWLS